MNEEQINKPINLNVIGLINKLLDFITDSGTGQLSQSKLMMLISHVLVIYYVTKGINAGTMDLDMILYYLGITTTGGVTSKFASANMKKVSLQNDK